jgi:hypothetical protein
VCVQLCHRDGVISVRAIERVEHRGRAPFPLGRLIKVRATNLTADVLLCLVKLDLAIAVRVQTQEELLQTGSVQYLPSAARSNCLRMHRYRLTTVVRLPRRRIGQVLYGAARGRR